MIILFGFSDIQFFQWCMFCNTWVMCTENAILRSLVIRSRDHDTYELTLIHVNSTMPTIPCWRMFLTCILCSPRKLKLPGDNQSNLLRTRRKIVVKQRQPIRLLHSGWTVRVFYLFFFSSAHDCNIYKRAGGKLGQKLLYGTSIFLCYSPRQRHCATWDWSIAHAPQLVNASTVNLMCLRGGISVQA